MKFVRIGEDTIRLDMIVRIREGRVDETLYGRSVRKTNDRVGWIEVHFVVGEALKIVGPAAELLKTLLEEEYGLRDLSQPVPDDWGGQESPRTSLPERAIPPPKSHRSGF
jgi:hypothetical protein